MKYNNEPVDSKTNIMATEIPKISKVQTQYLTHKHTEMFANHYETNPSLNRCNA